jgi:putative ABC transport system permease protein
VAIAAVLVYDVISLSLEERRRNLAVVAAVGGSRRVVVGGTMLEGAALGLAGGVIGAIGAILLARPITASMSSFTEKFVGIPFGVHVSAMPFVVGAVMGTLIGAAATWLPARRAMRMDVAAELSNRGLRDEQAPRLRLGRGLVWLALGLVGLGACWLGQRGGALEKWQLPAGQLGVVLASVAFLVAAAAFAPIAIRAGTGLVRRSSAVARLGLANLVREPGRTGTMSVAVGTPVATAFIISSFIIAIHAGVTQGILKGTAGKVRVSTVAVNNTTNVDAKIPPATITALQGLPGVAGVDRSASVLTGHVANDLIGVVAYEHSTLPFTIIKGAKDRARFERGEALIGPGLARRRHLRPGDHVRLATPTGWARVPVQGVWQDGNFNGNSVTVPFPLLERLYGPQPAHEVFLRPAPGVTAGRLVTEVRAARLGPTVQAQSPRRLAELIARDIKGQFASFWALQRSMLLVAFVAVLSTLLLVGIQRRRELALLAAVGMRPDELARMVLAEGMVVALVGTVLSAFAGLAMFTAFHQMVPVLVGFRDPFRLDPRAIVLYGAVATAIVLLAASWPAWRAARLEVVEALQYE